MVIDPDWKPNMDLINKADLSLSVTAYEFKIWDRSGITTRNCNWLMLHQPGLTFDYYVHEFLRYPNGGPYEEDTLTLGWEVAEVESAQSWHQSVGHGTTVGASRSYSRIMFDVSLLLLEQSDPAYRDSQHTLYYLGAAHCALVEGSPTYAVPFLNPGSSLTPLERSHALDCVRYLSLRIGLHGNAQEEELTWSAHRWRAYALFYILGDYGKALEAYGECVEFDGERVDCKVEMSKVRGEGAKGRGRGKGRGGEKEGTRGTTRRKKTRQPTNQKKINVTPLPPPRAPCSS